MAERIPATVITGFLGAGKTSLIRHLIENNQGKRLAFLINEFGDLGIDKELLVGCGIEGCSEDDVVELANGCICCTVADDFVPSMEALLDRPLPPDHILIETSGLALPKPLIKAFNWPEIRNRVTVDGVITVVDGKAAAEGQFADDPIAVQAARESDPALDHESPLEELYEDQLQCADIVVLNKTDLLQAGEAETLAQEIQSKLRDGVKLIRSAHAMLTPSALLGLGVGAESDLDTRRSHHDGEDDNHDHDDFDSFAVRLGEISDATALERILSALVAEHGILRIKGFLDRPGRDRREVFHGVGPRFQRYFDREWRAGEERGSKLVFIGFAGFNKTAIAAALR